MTSRSDDHRRMVVRHTSHVLRALADLDEDGTDLQAAVAQLLEVRRSVQRAGGTVGVRPDLIIHEAFGLLGEGALE